jgi:hypothetical protein
MKTKTKLLLALGFAGCIANAQTISTIAGTGAPGYSGDGAAATSAKIDGPSHSVFNSGNFYIADTYNNVIRKINTSGTITTVAGNGFGYTAGQLNSGGFGGDLGQATAAELNSPLAVDLDAFGNMYIADYDNNRIRKVNTAGIISTYAGTGVAGYSGNGGQATAAKLSQPAGLTFDASGNMYIAEFGNSVIRKITTSGIISTYAGTGVAGYGGDAGQATSAKLYQSIDMVFDASGNMYIADFQNNRVRKVNTSGIISTVAGNGTFGYTGDAGQATSAEIGAPYDVAVDSYGNLYIADGSNGVIRKVMSGIISTVVGNGVLANLNVPDGINFDASDNLYIGEQGGCRVRKVTGITKCPANAGPNVQDIQTCTSWSVQIGTPTVTNMTYTWSPSTRLSSTTIAQPICNYSSSNTLTAVYTVTVSNSLCITNTSTVQVTPVPLGCPGCCREAYTGIAKQNQTPLNFLVFPNPSNGVVMLSLPAVAEYIRVIDMQGRLIFEVKNITTENYVLDISKYGKGVYFISAKMGEAIDKQKLMVE